MRSCFVVVLLPGGEFDAGMPDRGEERFVQAFVAEPSVEAFHEAVLHWFAWRDVVPLNGSLLAPSQDRHAGQFRAVVADNGLRLGATLPDQRVEFPCNTDARQRRIRHQGKAFACEVVDDGEDAEPATVREGVRHEVQRPSLVRPIRQRHRRPRAQSPLPTAAAAHLELLFAIKTPKLLLVHRDPFPGQQQMQTSIDIGCVASHGHFFFNQDAAQYTFVNENKPATAFLFKLISQLQFSGTVPMIDIEAYSQWLTK